MLGEDVDEWLVKNVGIRERRVMADGDVTSDLVSRAAAEALGRAGLGAADLDLVVVATDTPDYLSPATASVVQHKLGARNAGVFDLNSACAGWVTALDLAARYIMTDPGLRYALVAGGYGMTRYVDWRDKHTCTLFADGAGAVLLGAAEEPGFLGGRLLCRGEYHDALGIYTGGTARPATPEVVSESGKPSVRFVKKFPRTFNSDNWPPLLSGVAERAGLAVSDVDLFLFTQLNLRTIEQVMDRLGQPMHKTHWVMDQWGYTGSACIPMALDDALHGGRARHGFATAPRRGEHVLFCASGGGLAMAASLWRWTR
jgi:3-oxoacyl-[acyl-carrier-protein] synthase-3